MEWLSSGYIGGSVLSSMIMLNSQISMVGGGRLSRINTRQSHPVLSGAVSPFSFSTCKHTL